MQWRLIIDPPADGATNMAVDEAILLSHAAGEVPPTLRLYRWKPPALSLGYFQDAGREVDADACARMGYDVVRRPTGGRAVLHDRELTYSVVISQALLPGTVLETYRWLSGGLLGGLELLGVPAELSRPGGLSEPGSAACFDSPSAYELVVGGKKLIGSAQTRRQDTILQHGAILIGLDAAALFRGLRFPSEAVRRRAREAFLRHATCLESVLGRPVEVDEVAAAMSEGFRRGLVIELDAGELTARERDLAARLRAEKYSRPEWNLERGVGKEGTVDG